MSDSAETAQTTQPRDHLQLSIVGLGRMGANIARRIKQHAPDGSEIAISVYDVNPETVTNLAKEGFVGLDSLDSLSQYNNDLNPQFVWIMVPAEVTAETIRSVAQYLAPGSTIIDGGNTFYRDDIANAVWLATKGINFVDVGTSGGVFGLERGYSLMIGGESEIVNRLHPIFIAMAPGIEAAPITPGTEGSTSTAQQGFYHCGPVGSGHFVKMVHNGIEYGLMQAFGEGFDILRNKDSVDLPESERLSLNLADIAEVWRRGSVVSSWLLDLAAAALARDPALSTFSGYVQDSGEGRWTVEAAIEEAVPADVLTTALYARFRSREAHTFAEKMLSAMRVGFGGHEEGREAIDPESQPVGAPAA